MNRIDKKPVRRRLPHEKPFWVATGSCYFVTVCAAEKGCNQLIAPVTAQAIAESFQFNMARGIWWVELLVVMPDHLHALMKFPVEPGIGKAVGNWKHFLSRTHNIHWQRDFFEHRLRNDEQQIEKAHYIRMNPVRRGLVTEPEAWPFIWTFDDLKDCGGQGTGRPTGSER